MGLRERKGRTKSFQLSDLQWWYLGVGRRRNDRYLNCKHKGEW